MVMKMNSCHHKYDLIAYRLNMRDPAEHRRIEEHIMVCPQCQQAMQIELEIDKDLSTPLDPGNIENIVIRKLRIYKEIETTPWWQYSLRICLNMMTSFAVGLGLWIFFSKKIDIAIWLNDLSGSMGNIDPANPYFFAIVGIYIAILMASILFAFRKNVLKYIIEL